MTSEEFAYYTDDGRIACVAHEKFIETFIEYCLYQTFFDTWA